jgi:hypothetical protein
MAKAKLEFDLNDMEDRMEFERITKATDMALVLWELLYNTRKSLCYEFDGKLLKGEKPSVFDGIDAVLDKLREELSDRGLNIDKLIM